MRKMASCFTGAVQTSNQRQGFSFVIYKPAQKTFPFLMEGFFPRISIDKTTFMKKKFFLAGVAFALAVSVSAQTKKKVPPPPPKPPKPPVEILKDIPPPPPPPLPPPPLTPPPPEWTQEEIAELPEDFQDFLKRNPSVGSIHWNNNSIFIISKKGKADRYVLNEDGIRQAEAKYGKLPTSPPPPPKQRVISNL